MWFKKEPNIGIWRYCILIQCKIDTNIYILYLLYVFNRRKWCSYVSESMMSDEQINIVLILWKCLLSVFTVAVQSPSHKYRDINICAESVGDWNSQEEESFFLYFSFVTFSYFLSVGCNFILFAAVSGRNTMKHHFSTPFYCNKQSTWTPVLGFRTSDLNGTIRITPLSFPIFLERTGPPLFSLYFLSSPPPSFFQKLISVTLTVEGISLHCDSTLPHALILTNPHMENRLFWDVILQKTL